MKFPGEMSTDTFIVSFWTYSTIFDILLWPFHDSESGTSLISLCCRDNCDKCHSIAYKRPKLVLELNFTLASTRLFLDCSRSWDIWSSQDFIVTLTEVVVTIVWITRYLFRIPGWTSKALTIDDCIYSQLEYHQYSLRRRNWTIRLINTILTILASHSTDSSVHWWVRRDEDIVKIEEYYTQLQLWKQLIHSRYNCGVACCEDCPTTICVAFM